MTKEKRNQSKHDKAGQPTWLQIVTAACGKDPLALTELYAIVIASPKAAGKRNVQAKVRQTLYTHPEVFVELDAGVWALARFFKEADVKALHRDRKKRLASRRNRTR
jgi:hypothetical protein